MIRAVCDSCGTEMLRNDPRRKGHVGRLAGEVQRNGHSIMFEVITGIDRTWNAGHLCTNCIIEAIAGPRPSGEG